MIATKSKKPAPRSLSLLAWTFRGLALTILSFSAFSATAQLDTSVLPAPIFEKEPGYVDLYWKAWELAYAHIAHDDGAVQSPFMDEGRVEGKISLWESAFTAQFTKYAPDIFPGIESLNEYYAQIHDNASSSQTIEHEDNPPILAWAEWRHFLMTGDIARVKWLLEEKEYPQKHFAWFHDTHVAQWDQWKKGYHWTHAASGMVNSPRGRHAGSWDKICDGDEHSWTCTEPSIVYPAGDSFTWLDAIAQQCLSARCIQLLAEAIGNEPLAAEWKETWKNYQVVIGENYYRDHLEKFVDGHPMGLSDPQGARTPVGFWTLLCEAASTERAGKMVANMVANTGFFGDAAPFPSLIPGDIDADRQGRAWRGGVYAPLVYMAIQGMQKYGYTAEAAKPARNMVEHMYRTFVEYEPHTIWEAYSPTERKPATDTGGVEFVHPDYVGWSGVGPISLFIEYVLGFHTIDAPGRRVEWNLHWPEKHGIRRLSFGTVVTDIVYDNGTVTVTSNEAYTLVINGEEHAVSTGEPVTIAVQQPPAPEPAPSLARYPVGMGTRVEAEAEVEYPADTGNTYYEHLAEWPWRFLCECSQGWKAWVRPQDEPYHYPLLPSGNALLFRVAYNGASAEKPVEWILTVNGEEHSTHGGYGGEWQYVLVRDVPLNRESNTITLERSTVNFFSVDFVEVLTLEDGDVAVESSALDDPTEPAGSLIQPTVGRGLLLSVLRPGMTTVDLLDLTGRRVARLSHRYMTRGTHRLSLPRHLGSLGRVCVVRVKTAGATRTELLVSGTVPD